MTRRDDVTGAGGGAAAGTEQARANELDTAWTWADELDAMEAYLAAQREAFSYRDVERPPVRRPSPLRELGPLPPSLRARAEELLRATRAFEGEVSDARASVATALRHVSRRGRVRAAYVDARA